MPEPAAHELLQNGSFGVLSLVDTNGGAYGIPLNFAWDGNNTIYVHCATQGHKLNCLNACADTSFCVVGNSRVIPEKFSTDYSSVVAKCKAELVSDDNEKLSALEMLVKKYSPTHTERGKEYAQNALQRVAVIKLSIVSFSGKKY